MSTLIQFRVSGEDEQALLAAARHAGMRPADYVRHAAKLSANRPDSALDRIERRLAELESKLTSSAPAEQTAHGPATLVKGLEATDLILELRREQIAGINAILRLLDGEPLPDIPHRRPSSGLSEH
ncbi:MAG: hypothetical protein E2593_05085 [Stenotrophomonas sp.]|nr:hypothetical protein [Stenotrophomonas sp.]